jgi:hypothetical protein
MPPSVTIDRVVPHEIDGQEPIEVLRREAFPAPDNLSLD